MPYTCKIFKAVNLNTSCGIVFVINTHVCTILKYINKNEDKEIYLSNKEFISGHICERKLWLPNVKSL